jgi:hypothetical protein
MIPFVGNLVLVIALIFGTSAGATETNWHIDINANDLTPQNLVFLPGAFEIDEFGNRFNSLCLPSQGRWIRAGEHPDPCPIVPGTTSPPPKVTFKLGAGPEGAPAFVVGNLGISNEQWARIKSSTDVPARSDDEALRQIGKAVDLVRTDQAVRWRFQSALLPKALDAEIPGSGIFFHIQHRLRDSDEPFIFKDGANGLLIEAKLGMPDLALTGSATSGVTIGISLQTEDVSGKRAPLPLIVGVFHSRGDAREVVSTDGRNTFVESMIAKGASFVVPIAGKPMSSNWAGRMVFSFRIDSQCAARLVKAVNDARMRQGEPLLNTDLSLVRLKQLDLRNENRFLDKGTVAITLDTEYLRARVLGGDGR